MKIALVLILVCACASYPEKASAETRGLSLRWNSAALQGVRDSKLAAPVRTRASAIVHTCIYDAWAAYDEHAIGTQLGGALRRPAFERSLANKEKAISYAAYRALTDVLPGDTESVYNPLMKQLGYDPNDRSTDIETPTGIGNVACAAVLEFRHHDKSNQLGDLAQGPYSDWTHYRPVNMPIPFPVQLPVIHPIDMNHWEPLTYVNSTGDLGTQMFTAHWCFVKPFAMLSGDEFRSVSQSLEPASYGSSQYLQQAQELVDLSANLTDRQKAVAEYWSDPDIETPERWIVFAEWVSQRDHHTLDDDVKMFFALSNTLLDTSIAVWDLKRAHDSMRPVTVIPMLLHDKRIRAWAGPGKGALDMSGSKWIPYQPPTDPSPPSPDYVSAQSAYSMAAASILTAWTGSDKFGYSMTVAPGSSTIEPGRTPAHQVVLEWATFTAAAEQAGIAGLYGGIQFRRDVIVGQRLGSAVAQKVLSKARSYVDGESPSGSLGSH